DTVNADTIVAGQAALTAKIGREGFPFATVGAPNVVVDHATHTATLELAVDPGAPKRFGKIFVNPDNHVFGADHLTEIARFAPGQPYDSNSLDDLHRALIQTGLVSVADVKPVDAGPGIVDVAVKLEPAPPRTIAGELGYGTGEGARAEVDWTHRNLFPPEGALTLRAVAGTQEQLAGVIFRRNNFHGRDRVLNGQLTLSNLQRTAYRAKTASLSGSLERQTNIFFQKKWTWSVGAELTATDERDVDPTTGAPRKQIYYIAALPGTLNYDGSDDLLDPHKGFRLGGRLSPEVSFEGKTFGYARAQIDASAYHPFGEKVVLAGRIRLGTIAGAPRDAIAPSRRFYAGGGASVRGYGYQDIGPRDPNNVPIGGRSLAEFSIEARVKTFGNFGIVPFLDGGNIYTSATPKVTDLRYGAGLGLRYYSNFGPIRIDVGTPINPVKGDPRVAVYVSLGQAF
ncbi:MAG: BamA/TamA family outer membrane protein, partial [Sphingomonas sp.]